MKYVRQELRQLQVNDLNLVPMIVYLENEALHKDEKAAKKLLFESKYYEMIDGVLHREHPTDPRKWCIVVPKEEQSKLLKEYHGGQFAGNFAERKMYSTLRRQYWWKSIWGVMCNIIVILAYLVLQ